MEKKRIRNPRVFVDTPPQLKADYEKVCQWRGITVSEDIRAHMRRAVVVWEASEEDAERESAA